MDFIKIVYDSGWPSGWREYDMESHERLKQSLADVGVDCANFDVFMQPGGLGEQELAECQSTAEAEGIVGIPHYSFEDPETGKQLGVFGREHLALIRSKLHAEGLARHGSVSPECSHAFVPRPSL